MRKFLARLRFWRRKRSYADEILADDPWGYWPLGNDLNNHAATEGDRQ